MSNTLEILKIPFQAWWKVQQQYLSMQDQNKKSKSVKFGVSAIVFAIFAFISIPLCALGLQAVMGSDNILFLIFGIIFFAVAIIYLPLQFVMYSIFYTIFQFKVNKNWIRWLSLAVTILALIGSVLIIAFVIQ